MTQTLQENGQQQEARSAAAAVLDQYAEAMSGTPLLGWIAFYSIFDGQVAPDTLARWFAELGLDPSLLPPAIRADGAFETVTHDMSVSYDIPAAGRRAEAPKRPAPGSTLTATLMIRRVSRDKRAIVSQLVREVRDAGAARLKYKAGVADIVFTRDDSAPGAGHLTVTPNLTSVPEREHEQVTQMCRHVREQFDLRCRYLTGDKVRAMLHNYIETLHALKVRPTGGVYFVHTRHAATLAALEELLSRFGAGSVLYRIPLPDTDKHRVMVIEAFRAKAREGLQKLSVEIAAAKAGGEVKARTAESLYARFMELQAEANEHSGLLSADLDDTGDALRLAGRQIAELLASAA